MAGTTMTRAELLASDLHFDRWRDGTDAIPLGTAHTQVPYTGGTRISLDDTSSFERIVFLIRAHAAEFDPILVDGIDTKRAAQVPDHMVDWDCRYCEVAVMTEDTSDPCPRCLLT